MAVPFRHDICSQACHSLHHSLLLPSAGAQCQVTFIIMPVLAIFFNCRDPLLHTYISIKFREKKIISEGFMFQEKCKRTHFFFYVLPTSCIFFFFFLPTCPLQALASWSLPWDLTQKFSNLDQRPFRDCEEIARDSYGHQALCSDRKKEMYLLLF